MTNKNNLWNVAMDTCVMCWEPTSIIIQTKAGEDVFDWKKSVCSWGLCSKCEKIVSEWVSLHCINCWGVHVIKTWVLEETKAWEHYRVIKCPKCNEWQFQFWEPKA